jgi:two-component system sensor histidine kinase HydH
VNALPLLVPDDDRVLAYLFEDERRALEACEARVCLPLLVRGRLGSIMLLGRPNGRVPRIADRRHLLQRCADQAALAFDRAAEAEAERERLQAVSRTQQLAAAGQLAAAMAHEIRNPLAVIRSGVQLVAQTGADSAEQRQLLTEVVGEVDRINRAISNVLGFSRPRELSLARIDLRGVVDHALTLLEPYCSHHGIGVERHLPEAPVPAMADAGELHQVLLNVLLNACQASPDGGRIEIRMTTAEAAGRRQILTTIADAGRGMTDAEQAKAFEPFFTTKANGTGLGLSICRQIMARHGGGIDLHSVVARGTTVTLRLPAEAD